MAIVFFHPQVREGLKWLCGYQVMYSLNLSFYSVLETWWTGSEGIEGLHEEALYRRRRERQWSDVAVLCQRGSTVRTDDQSGHYININAALIGCFWPSRTSPNIEDLPCELVAGEGCIHEELLGLKFRISPHSFFQVPQSTSHFGLSNLSLPATWRWHKLWKQVNTGAAEVLYSAVGEWAQLDQDSTVLDVCCGTGTIGISLAKVTWLLWIIILHCCRPLVIFTEKLLLITLSF